MPETNPQKQASAPEAEYESSVTIEGLLVFLLAIFVGLVATAWVLPMWLPGLASSFTGSNPKAYWYMSRGAAFVAMGLLWMSMMLGIGITNKMARVWPGLPPAMAIHEYTSLLGFFFAGFHALVLLGDKYSNYSLVQLLMPFGSFQYRPTWVALGQIGFYIWFLIMLAFYIRKSLGKKTWRVVHYASFAAYLGALVHGLLSGTDTSAPWAQYFYWITGTCTLFVLMYRILTSKKTAHAPAARPAVNPAAAGASILTAIPATAQAASSAPVQAANPTVTPAVSPAPVQAAPRPAARPSVNPAVRAPASPDIRAIITTANQNSASENRPQG
jgi:predicted ferric reductase